jgi:hypothetical protein
VASRPLAALLGEFRRANPGQRIEIPSFPHEETPQGRQSFCFSYITQGVGCHNPNCRWAHFEPVAAEARSVPKKSYLDEFKAMILHPAVCGHVRTTQHFEIFYTTV